jgi:hypothetical protein
VIPFIAVPMPRSALWPVRTLHPEGAVRTLHPEGEELTALRASHRGGYAPGGDEDRWTRFRSDLGLD